MGQETIYEKIGKKIAEYRRGSGYSQQEFADMMGLGRSSLSLIEQGKQAPSLDIVIKIVNETSLELSELLQIETKNHVVIDTTVILYRPEILDLLVEKCDRVYIPRKVIDETNYRKDHGNEITRRNASLCLSKINEFNEKYQEEFTLRDPSVCQGNADDQILQVAKDVANENKTDKVFMLTNDKDFRLKNIEGYPNLKVIDTLHFRKEFTETNGDNEAISHRLFMGVVHRNLPQVKQIMEGNKGKNVNLNYIDTKSGLTPLIKAIKNRDHEMVKYLLSLGRVDIDAVDNYKHRLPPISHAIQAHDYKVVQLLIEKGANVNEPSQSTTNFFNTPLMIAAWENELDCVKLLVEKHAIVNQQDHKNGFTALIKAAFQGNVDIIEYLLKIGADTTIQSYEKKTALDYAYDKNDRESIDLLRKSYDQ